METDFNLQAKTQLFTTNYYHFGFSRNKTTKNFQYFYQKAVLSHRQLHILLFHVENKRYFDISIINREMETRYIFITGGVASSLGKGIISASLGKLLQARGYRITIQKFDPYINIDPGTLNPYEHGECYVTADGMETDLDLGHYERFTPPSWR